MYLGQSVYPSGKPPPPAKQAPLASVDPSQFVPRKLTEDHLKQLGVIRLREALRGVKDEAARKAIISTHKAL